MEIGQQQQPEMGRESGPGGETEKPEQSADEFHLQSKIKCEKKQRRFSLFEVKLLFQKCVARRRGRENGRGENDVQNETVACAPMLKLS